MITLNSNAIRFENNQTYILDQQLLPAEEKWLACESVNHMVDIIKQLKVRGAPLIGIAASAAICQYALSGADKQQLCQACEQLTAARPTAVNLAFCMTKMQEALRDNDDVKQACSEMFQHLYHEDVNLCEQIAHFGAELIAKHNTILTYCNTGSLATAGCGTALGIINHANQQHTKHVYICETRPLLQGARLTAWECQQANIDYTLICDNMAAGLMAKKRIDCIIVGADRIAANGDTANKIGTYNLAVLAHYHHVPFYVAAPYTTFDETCATGDDIVIEQRKTSEVQGVDSAQYHLRWAPEEATVYNPAFDVTPHQLITAFISEQGIRMLN